MLRDSSQSPEVLDTLQPLRRITAMLCHVTTMLCHFTLLVMPIHTNSVLLVFSNCALSSCDISVVHEICTFCHIGRTCNVNPPHDLLDGLVGIFYMWSSSHIPHISKCHHHEFVHVLTDPISS